MQSIAAYSFDAEVADSEQRLSQIDRLVDAWLTSKGASTAQAHDGDFTSKSGDGTGQFSRRAIVSSVGITRSVELIETARSGAMVTTTFQVARSASRIWVFANLSATPGVSVVAPLQVIPRCPGIIRELIRQFPDWRFAGQHLPVGLAFDASQSTGIKDLCVALQANDRRLPLLVVSADEDEQVWLDLPSKAAEQLIGLVDVALVSAESSWQLTDELGPQDSCYLGAVRLYWPLKRPGRGYEGITWTAAKLRKFGEGDAGRNRFLDFLRGKVMAVSALTMVQPSIFREVESVATKERIQSLGAAAREQELDEIVRENAQLTAQLDEEKRRSATLQWKLAALSSGNSDTALAEEASQEAETPEAADQPPKAGEVRYYKKIGSGGGIDALVQTGPCNHKASSWKPAFKGDQAEKGLLKLEGRNDWQSLAHCSGCKGGGRWKVHW